MGLWVNNKTWLVRVENELARDHSDAPKRSALRFPGTMQTFRQKAGARGEKNDFRRKTGLLPSVLKHAQLSPISNKTLPLHLPLQGLPYFYPPLGCPRLLDGCLYSLFLLPHLPLISSPLQSGSGPTAPLKFVKVTNDFLLVKPNEHLSFFVLLGLTAAMDNNFLLEILSVLHFHNPIVS